MDRGKQDPTRKSRHLSLVSGRPETDIENPPSPGATRQEIMTLLGGLVLAVVTVVVVVWLA